MSRRENIYDHVRGIVGMVLRTKEDVLPLDERIARAVFAALDTHICAVCHQEASRPDLRGTMWCEKKYQGKGIWMSFSTALLGISGGLERLLADWEIVEDNRSEAQKAMKP